MFLCLLVRASAGGCLGLDIRPQEVVGVAEVVVLQTGPTIEEGKNGYCRIK